MNTNQNNYKIDCQYSPVYISKNTGAIQGKSFTVAQRKIEEVKPLSNNLKLFYENSGLFESNIPIIPEPRILKKQQSKPVTNSLTLASVLVPNLVDIGIEESLDKQCFNADNVVLKLPPLAPANAVITVPKVIDRKIVKIKDLPRELKAQDNQLTKTKHEQKSVHTVSNPTKHTVQLLKLGETYHSLNQLSEKQMEMVNQALKIFNNPRSSSNFQATFDPVTNTHFVYKVVSPKEINTVGQNKIVIDNNKEEPNVELKVIQEKELKPQQLSIKETIPEKEPDPPVAVKITRSGRKVKSPKQIIPDKTTHKPKRKVGALVSCFHCSTEFCSFYRLQKHYEIHPTHIPANIHINLFHCLLAIIKGAPKKEKSNVFIKLLQQLVDQLRSLRPCLLTENYGNERNCCTINEDIGRLLGTNPGKYNINVDALTCIRDKDGNCRHNSPKTNQFNSDPSTTSQKWFTKDIENSVELDYKAEHSNTSLVNKRPIIQKKVWNSKSQKSQQFNVKKRKEDLERSELIKDEGEGIQNLLNFNYDQSAIKEEPMKSVNKTENSNTRSLVNKRPITQKRVGNSTPPKTQQFNARKRKESSERSELVKDVEKQGLINFDYDQSAIKEEPHSKVNNLDNHVDNKEPIQKPTHDEYQNPSESCISSGTHTQFHSTHFDIRSSPIKPSTGVFRKFQINPETLAKYEVQINCPLKFKNSLNQIYEETSEPMSAIPREDNNTDLHNVFKDDLNIQLSLSKDACVGIPPELSFDICKDWIIPTISDKSNESFKSGLIEPSCKDLHETTINNSLSTGNLISDTKDQIRENDSCLLSNQSSALNFLESLGHECLIYPETEITSNSTENCDFQLDLFSFK